ncbi:globoside alpha-1,3-N-acetylgalactosaminyltransferase 1 isoform X2 [Gadus morhua]|uniref:Globoside alpha-1,3-N-acetylgalactosaminyltransferase 1-like n=1 Tax=Gadus morhua TaxID=8049 RepID=A0A8C4ZF89_GADMO|nr:globoside alpha-1,3-N-acetylgalactosaminyltransferase 1-like isoform X2 [Gadus morhua]
MLCFASKYHLTVCVAFLLIFLGGVYFSEVDRIRFKSFFPENRDLPKDLPRICPENGDKNEDQNSWRITELIMEKGLKYTKPSVMKGRMDVNPVTNWNAPLVWEGTFDPVVIDSIYKRMDPRIAVIVFAVGKYTRFLKGFLESGEKHFMVDFKLTYYIFTDHVDEVPKIDQAMGRKITILPVPSATRWQDVVLGRMKYATIAIDQQIRNQSDYIFMMDIDSLFHGRVGAESLSRMSAVLHRGYYKDETRKKFPYERRPQSQAYIPMDEGDYYYSAAVWGGYLEDMYKLVRYCYEQSEIDSKNNIEAVWQEESHLNKYLLHNKPTKVLSPEYLWSDYDRKPEDIKVVRISQLVKNYAEVRPNGGH